MDIDREAYSELPMKGIKKKNSSIILIDLNDHFSVQLPLMKSLSSAFPDSFIKFPSDVTKLSLWLHNAL